VRLLAATRGSELARWQTDHVAGLLAPAAEVEAVVVETTGDRRLDVPIWEMGGKGVFVKEVQAAVLDGRADLAVHSAKDLPSVPTPGLVIACVPRRADPRDALVGARLAELPPGARVATGSVRRRAQLAWLRPDLTFAGLRGNIATRLGKVGGGVDAVVVAKAALDRLGLGDRADDVLSPVDLVPQVGQGALAVECREGDEDVLAALRSVEDRASRVAVDAERGFLAELGGSCDLPAGALATVDGDGVTVEAVLATLDGRIVLRHRTAGPAADPAAVGRAAALHLLDRAGGRALLAG
jgi:hydroxymethylbilane synthase